MGLDLVYGLVKSYFLTVIFLLFNSTLNFSIVIFLKGNLMNKIPNLRMECSSGEIGKKGFFFLKKT